MDIYDSEAENEALAARMTEGHFGGFEYRRQAHTILQAYEKATNIAIDRKAN